METTDRHKSKGNYTVNHTTLKAPRLHTRVGDTIERARIGRNLKKIQQLAGSVSAEQAARVGLVISPNAQDGHRHDITMLPLLDGVTFFGGLITADERGNPQVRMEFSDEVAMCEQTYAHTADRATPVPYGLLGFLGSVVKQLKASST